MGLFESLRRDLTQVANNLLGHKAPPAMVRKPARSVVATRRLRVEAVIRETLDAVTLVLVDPTGAPFRYQPGQFFTVLVPMNGEVVRRAYSASGDPDDTTRLLLTAKRVAGGRVSNHLNDAIVSGSHLEVLGPSGSFVPAANRAHRLLVAGGSGITPMMAIIEWALRHESGRLTLIYGNRGEADVIFRDRLEKLGGPRLRVVHVLSSPPPGWSGETGMLDRDTLSRLLPDDPAADCFLCGPEPMMVAARAALEARGMTSIHEERFSQPHLRTAAAPTVARRVVLGSRSLEVAPGQTLLDAGLAAGVSMPYSCTVGGCGACKLTLRAGVVEMEEPNCLTPAERAAGGVLTCVGRPASDGVRLELP